MNNRIETIKEKAAVIRHAIVDMIGCTGKVGHLGGSSSIADIVAALYFDQMKHDPHNPKAPDRDRFLLSKGHAALAQYAALAEAGYFSKDELKKVKHCGAMLQGHPDMNHTPGIEANTGSLGQGLSLGLGMALGLKIDGNPAQVFVLMGDGEQAEGQIWEAAMAAANFKTGNLIGILDCNKVQAMGPVKDRMDSGDLKAKWASFGWHIIEIDGHDVEQILTALEQARAYTAGPVLIFANTIKGKYISFAEGNAAFHNGALTEEQYHQAHADIDRAAV